MELHEEIKKPSKEEQKVAMEFYKAMAATLEELKSTNPEVEIEETDEKFKQK